MKRSHEMCQGVENLTLQEVNTELSGDDLATELSYDQGLTLIEKQLNCLMSYTQKRTYHKGGGAGEWCQRWKSFLSNVQSHQLNPRVLPRPVPQSFLDETQPKKPSGNHPFSLAD